MNKKTTETTETKQQPTYVAELLKSGTAILIAKTRDELAKMVNDIPSDVRYAAGAVGFNPDSGVFSLRVDINT